MMILSLVAMTVLEKCCITSAYLQWLIHRWVSCGPWAACLSYLPLVKLYALAVILDPYELQAWNFSDISRKCVSFMRMGVLLKKKQLLPSWFLSYLLLPKFHVAIDFGDFLALPCFFLVFFFCIFLFLQTFLFSFFFLQTMLVKF